MSGADQVPQDGEAADDEGLPSEDETSAELSDRQYPAPSQRQWIHPAELPSTRAVTAPPMAPRRWVTAPLGIAASVMLIAGIALLVIHPKAGSHPATTAVAIGSSPDGATAARIASHSLVTITDGPTHSILGDGMTLSPATMIATTAPVHKGAIVELTSSTGAHTSAHVVGQDPVTGVSVVAADHAISTTTSIGSLPSSTTPVVDVALTAPSSGTTPNVVWMGATAATATSTSTSAPTGLPVGVLQSSAALEGPPGDVLLDGAGQAIALEAPKLGTHDYLPAGLVAELATQLEHGGTVSHARLGITGKSAPTPGATVVSVDHSGPAAGVLVPGDTITAMDHMTVASMPDLLDCLYGYAAKSVVEVDFVHNGTPEVATLTLGSAP
jgi:S1-C subfamily serine protease